MKLRKILVISLIFIFAMAAMTQAVEMKIPKIEKKTLDNGLSIYVIEQHEVPVVSMRLDIPGGAIYETEETAGLANLTASLLRKGTQTRTSQEISQEIDYVGGSLGAGAGRDAVYCTSRVLSKHLDKGMELLADIAINPIFPDEEVQKQKDQFLGGIMQSKSDPTSIRNNQFDKYLFGQHPYAFPSMGTEETMMLLTADDVKDFYNKYIIPNNSFLLIVGDVNAKDVISKAQKYFGKWKAGTVAEVELPAPPEITGHKIILIDKPDATQSYIEIGHLGITRTNPDAFVTRVMNYILGGGGFASRLTKQVRGEEGLTYGIGSNFDFNKYPGAFVVQTFTKNESTGHTVELIFNELDKIRNAPVDEKELSETKSFYSGYLPLQFETPESIASYMETIYLHNLGEDYYSRYIKAINAATAEDVQKVAQEYIHPENILIVVVGKADEVKPQLEQFGDVTVIPMIEL